MKYHNPTTPSDFFTLAHANTTHSHYHKYSNNVSLLANISNALDETAELHHLVGCNTQVPHSRKLYRITIYTRLFNILNIFQCEDGPIIYSAPSPTRFLIYDLMRYRESIKSNYYIYVSCLHTSYVVHDKRPRAHSSDYSS